MEKMRVQESRIIIGPPGEVTINFDSHITEVSMRDEGGLHTWTASGQTFQTNCEDGSKYTFNVTLADGYILDQATGLGGDFGIISTVVRETSFTVTGGLAGVSGTITLTSKATASVPTPDWANCFVKTSAGNKAVEKVWIKQGSSLNVVWEKPLITYTVTNTLTHCTSNNSAKTATQGTSYTATITANSGYTLDGATVSVTMGGTNITSTAYSNGVITIASVTGDIVVRVSAVQEPSQTPVNIIIDLTVKVNNGGVEPNGIMLMSALTGDQRPADNVTVGNMQAKLSWENVMYMAGEDLLLFVHTVPQGRYDLSIRNRPVATPTFPSSTPVPLQEYIPLVYGTILDGQTVQLTLEQQ